MAPIVGALAGGLAQMVLHYSIGKRALAEHESELQDACGRMARARQALLQLAEADASAYAALNDAFRLPKEDPDRPQAIAAGADAAVVPPMATMATCIDLLRLFERLRAITNRQLASDLRIAAILAEAAVRASAENIWVNLPLLGDARRAEELSRECERSVAEACRRSAAVLARG
ncbi:MAG: hypothetical protein Kow0022_12690 [Phycisphaerales bacterium]